MRLIARWPETLVGFGETCIHAQMATFELRASEIASPRPGAIGGETFVIKASRSDAIPSGWRGRST